MSPSATEKTTLETLKKLNAARTKGEWQTRSMPEGFFNVIFVGEKPPFIAKVRNRVSSLDIHPIDRSDATFIAAAANNFDRLLAVCEAAKAVCTSKVFGDCKGAYYSEAALNLSQALAALESSP